MRIIGFSISSLQKNRELSLNTRPQAPSLPLDGSAVLNDTPVACQTSGPTDPQGDRWRGEAVANEVSPRSGVKPPVPAAAGYFAPRRERFLCLRRG